MEKAITVSEVNRYIREILAHDMVLSGLWVKGEVSNCKYHYSGHMYFTLKDDKSLLKCVMFRSHAAGLRFVLENGMKVLIRGYISVFERDGQYQLYAEEIRPDGVGALHTAYEQLKNRLSAEGLFDRERKRRLPFLPRRIGVVTSSTGAVIRDIVNVITRRYPNVELRLYPVQVQGEQAAGQIARAIDRLNELDCADVIIVARGGGSLEELWAFNEEVVARSIFSSRLPVVSAVGHETDFTIADFVADLRAPTPSAAAELVVPEKTALEEKLAVLEKRLTGALVKKVDVSRLNYDKILKSTVFRQPLNMVYQERMRLDLAGRALLKAARYNSDKSCKRLAALVGRLDALSPLAILARGYGIVRGKKDGGIVKSIGGITAEDLLEVRVSDGSIDCRVEKVSKIDLSLHVREYYEKK